MDSSSRVIVTARRVIDAGLRFLGRRILGFTQAIAAEQKDLGVLHQPVGDGSGDGRVEENVSPIGKGRV